MPNTKRQKRTAGDRILAAMKEAVAISQGKLRPSRTWTLYPAPDVRVLRRKLHLSQDQFAKRFGLAPATIRNWEQGRTIPDAHARVLLAIIERHPKTVESVVRSLVA